MVNGTIETTPFICSFPYVFKLDQYGRYSITMLFKKDSPTLKVLKDAAEAAKEKQWGGKAPKKFKHPLFVDGTEMNKARVEEGKEPLQGYDGMVIVTAKASEGYPPKVRAYPSNEIIDDPAEIYGGCICRAKISVYTYDNQWGKGLGVGLWSLQKLANGKRLGGGGGDGGAFKSDASLAGFEDQIETEAPAAEMNAYDF